MISPARTRLLRWILVLLALPGFARAQGSLTPPGPPSPTMRSLIELDASLAELVKKSEARIPIDTLPGDATALHIISQPGSYFLRGNLSTASNTVSAIRATADGVVIDLNGFALLGSGGGSTAFGIDGNGGIARRHVYRNGTITGWSTGINAGDAALVEDLVIENSRQYGVLAPSNSIVRQVLVEGAGVTGIEGGTVENCRVEHVNSIGVAKGIDGDLVIGCTVRSVTSNSSGSAEGIRADVARECTVSNIIASGSGESRGYSMTLAENCSASSVYAYGAGSATGLSGLRAVNCRVSTVQSDGLASGITATGGRVDNCSVANVFSGTATSTILGVLSTNVSGTTVTSISGGGTAIQGINAFLAEGCTVGTVSTFNASGAVTAISAHLTRNCRVSGVSGTGATAAGIQGVVISDCHVHDIGPTAGAGYGIWGNPGANIRNNTVSDVRTYGIVTGIGSTVADNVIRVVGTDSGITNGAGIYASTTGSRITNNSIIGGTGSDYGIRTTAAQNFVVGNRCTGTFSGAATGATGLDTPEFNFVTGNRWGDVVSAFAATGEILATNPFSNFAD